MDVDILLYQPTWRKKGWISFNKGSKRKTWGGKKKINKFFHEVTRDYYYCLDGDTFATQLVRCSRRIYYSMYLMCWMCLGMLINCPGFLMNSTCSLVGLQTYSMCSQDYRTTAISISEIKCNASTQILPQLAPDPTLFSLVHHSAITPSTQSPLASTPVNNFMASIPVSE